MAQFDFPRINFHGRAYINVGTANNDDFGPTLVLNDLVKGVAYTPPRVTVTAAQKEALDAAGHPYNYITIETGSGSSKKTSYQVALECEATKDENYIEWARTPLGQSTLDTVYHPLYAETALSNAAQPQDSKTPGEWNYNGGMEIQILNADVVSVVTEPTDNSGSNVHTSSTSAGFPASLASFLGGTFNNVNDNGAPLGSICDMNPQAPYTSQFFYDGFWVRDANGKTVMNGSPSKGMTRWINFNRVVNVPPSPMIASGAMYHVITKEAMGTGWEALSAAFPATNAAGKALKGAMVRYSFYEVYEARNPDYKTQLPGFKPNPALATLLGSITPWYEGDMMSAPTGRILNPTPGASQPDITPKNAMVHKPNPLAPIPFQVNETKSIFSADLVNSLQENRILPDPNQATDDYLISTSPDIKLKYELTEVGTLDFRVGTSGTSPILASLNVNGSSYTIDDFINHGGVFDYVYSNPPTGIDSTTFSLWGTNAAGSQVALLTENPYYIVSDQNCTYFDQAASGSSVTTASKGMNQGTSPQDVYVRFFNYGKAVAQSSPIAFDLYAYSLDALFNLEYNEGASMLNLQLYDGLQLTDFNTAETMIYVSQFLPAGTGQQAASFGGGTEYYINWRVLVTPNFSQYYTADGKPNFDVLNYQVLYDEIFRSYYLMFPSMESAQSFRNHDAWQNRWVAGKLTDRVSLEHWMTSYYMPRTRTLSSAQRKLIDAWATKYTG